MWVHDSQFLINYHHNAHILQSSRSTTQQPLKIFSQMLLLKSRRQDHSTLFDLGPAFDLNLQNWMHVYFFYLTYYFESLSLQPHSLIHPTNQPLIFVTVQLKLHSVCVCARACAYMGDPLLLVECAGFCLCFLSQLKAPPLVWRSTAPLACLRNWP